MTADIFLLAQQLLAKQHLLSKHMDEHDSFEDALEVVVSYWKKDHVPPTDDALNCLAQRFLKPLFWRAWGLTTSGGDMSSAAPLNDALAVEIWQKWRDYFSRHVMCHCMETKNYPFFCISRLLVRISAH